MYVRPTIPRHVQGSGRRRCIAIDLSLAHDGSSFPGPASLPARFVSALLQHTPEVDYVVLVRAGNDSILTLLDAVNAQGVVLPDPPSHRRDTAWDRADRRLRRSRLSGLWTSLSSGRRFGLRGAGLKQVLHGNQPDVILCPFTTPTLSDRSVPTVSAVHDLQHLTHPYMLTAADRQGRSRASEAVRLKSSRLICATPSLRDAAVALLRLPAERVDVLAPGPLLRQEGRAMEDVPSDDGSLAQLGLRAKAYLLMPGDFEVRHNHRLVLTALGIHRASHRECDLKVVFAGAPGPMRASVGAASQRMGLAGSVVFADDRTPPEITSLTQNCLALLTPFLYESVGDSVLDAMTCGRPVVRGATVEPSDLIGDATLTIDPHRPSELVAVFRRLHEDPCWFEGLGDAGRQRGAQLVEPPRLARAFVDATLSASLARS
jgi:glycosyltransferase involved in cell wall biosynthesis